MRRYLSLMESNFPTELGGAYMNMENQGNPWGMSNATRGDWSAKVDGIEIVEPGDAFDHEYLYGVGCAGSFDDKNQKVSEAMAELMRRAGLDFALRGSNEMRSEERRYGQEGDNTGRL